MGAMCHCMICRWVDFVSSYSGPTFWVAKRHSSSASHLIRCQAVWTFFRWTRFSCLSRWAVEIGGFDDAIC